MAVDPSVVINIAAEYTGKKAFSKAETATKTLTKSVKGLAGAFGIAFGARGAMQAVKAFAADDKAAKVLSKTLNNLGLAFADPAVTKFISDLERQTGVLDDKLRPAYQMLLTSTGDYIKSQDLLRTALDLSAMSGVDVVSVSADLSKAYQGNTRGLMKYQLGLTKAELAAMSFEEILAQVAKVSSGQAQIAADSYAGSLDKLSVATANVAETLGKDLVDALAILGGEGGLPKTLSLIESMSGAIGTAIIYAARFARVLDIITGSGAFNMFGDLNKAFAEFEAQDKARAAGKFAATGMATSYQGKKAQDAAALAAAKKITKETQAQAKAAAALAKSKKEQAALDKATVAAQLALSKGTEIFDMEKIQLNAALVSQAEALGKATTGAQVLAIANDVARLRIKQDILALEEAIASKDTQAIIAATAKLNADLKVLSALQSQNFTMLSIKTILDSLMPKELIDQLNLDLALAKIKAMMDLLAGGTGKVGTTGTTGTTGTGGKKDFGIKDVTPIAKLTGNESIEAILEYSDAVTTLATVMADTLDAQNYNDFLSLVEFQKKLGDFGGYSANMNSGAGYGSGANVTVTVVDKTSGLIEVVQNAVQENNRFGNNLNFAGAL
jgi:hypothetical protein